MTGRERFLITMENRKADRMPCQVHDWMGYYLNNFLDGRDAYQAYKYFGMDPVIYVLPDYIYNEKDLVKWETKDYDIGIDQDGNHNWKQVITTPEGELIRQKASNQFTTWDTEHIIKNERDFEIWNKYLPIPEKVDWTPVIEAKKGLENTELPGTVSMISDKAAHGRALPEFCILWRMLSWQPMIILNGYIMFLRVCLKKN